VYFCCIKITGQPPSYRMCVAVGQGESHNICFTTHHLLKLTSVGRVSEADRRRNTTVDLNENQALVDTMCSYDLAESANLNLVESVCK